MRVDRFISTGLNLAEKRREGQAYRDTEIHRHPILLTSLMSITIPQLQHTFSPQQYNAKSNKRSQNIYGYQSTSEQPDIRYSQGCKGAIGGILISDVIIIIILPIPPPRNPQLSPPAAPP